MKKTLTALALVLSIIGCKITKDNHAYARVIGDPALSERTYRTLAISHPCVTEYTIGRDSIITDTVIDNTNLNNANKIIDSLLDKILNHSVADTTYLDVDSLREDIYTQIKKTAKPTVIHITDIRHDTARDDRAVNQLTNDNSTIKGQQVELNSQIKDLKKANTHKVWYMIGLGLLTLLGGFLYIKKK